MGEARGTLNVLLIGLGCALVLALTHTATRDRVQDNETRSLRLAIADLVPDPEAVPNSVLDLSSSPTSSWLCDGTLLALTDTTGYGGLITLLFTSTATSTGPESGIARLHRLTVTRHQETPGITDFLRQDQGWLSSLEGLAPPDLRRVDTVTGATITSRAIRDHLAAFLESAPETPPTGCER
jgi:Na+-translocating ferredoxin:NAD+ oxidoreductase RnfG subunit